MTTSAHHRSNHHPEFAGLLSDSYLFLTCFSTVRDYSRRIPPQILEVKFPITRSFVLFLSTFDELDLKVHSHSNIRITKFQHSYGPYATFGKKMWPVPVPLPLNLMRLTQD